MSVKKNDHLVQKTKVLNLIKHSLSLLENEPDKDKLVRIAVNAKEDVLNYIDKRIREIVLNELIAILPRRVRGKNKGRLVKTTITKEMIEKLLNDETKKE